MNLGEVLLEKLQEGDGSTWLTRARWLRLYSGGEAHLLW